jgi:hypothetical protein
MSSNENGVLDSNSKSGTPFFLRPVDGRTVAFVVFLFAAPFPLCMFSKFAVGFLFVPHMLFLTVAVPFVIIRRLVMLVRWLNRKPCRQKQSAEA